MKVKFVSPDMPFVRGQVVNLPKGEAEKFIRHGSAKEYDEKASDADEPKPKKRKAKAKD